MIPELLTGSNLRGLRRITSSSHRYIAEVDGLRFIAIFSVLLFHVYFAGTHVAGVALPETPYHSLFWPIINGHRGVHLFFVISGFILGLPFAAQFLTGAPAVNFGRFYLRRLTRLEPPYVIALLLFYTAAIAMHNDDSTQPGFLTGLLLRLGYVNDIILNERPSLNGVTWTLEIEVQFYLLVPLLAQIFRLSAWPRRILLIAAICAAPVLAPLTPRSSYTFLGYAQFFLAGFLLADIHSTGAGVGKSPAWHYDLMGFAGLLAFALAPETLAFQHLFPWLLAALFLGAVRGNWLTAVLRQPAIATLGGMCYSLYLLHYPLLSFLANKLVHNGQTIPMAYLRLAAVGLPIVVSSGVVYYIIIERPCMNPKWPALAYRRIAQIFGHA